MFVLKTPILALTNRQAHSVSLIMSHDYALGFQELQPSLLNLSELRWLA
jgi:hypothetical protein